MASSQPLNSLALFEDMTFHYVSPVLGLMAEAKYNPKAFAIFHRHVVRLDALLEKLGNRKANGPLSSCNILHQIRGALRNAWDFCQQYEAKGHIVPIIFEEVYNAKANHMEAQLLIISNRVSQLLNETGALNLDKLPRLSRAVASETASHNYAAEHSLSVIHSIHEALAASLEWKTQDPYLSKAANAKWADLHNILNRNPSHVNDYGNTYNLLHMAAMWQDPFAVAMLLSHNADINARTRQSELFASDSTALHIAAILGCAPVVKLLVAFGADLDAMDSQGICAADVPTTPICHELLTQFPKKLQGSAPAYGANIDRVQQLINKCSVALHPRFRNVSRPILLHLTSYIADMRSEGPPSEEDYDELIAAIDKLLPLQIMELDHVLWSLVADVKPRSAKSLGHPLLHHRAESPNVRELHRPSPSQQLPSSPHSPSSPRSPPSSHSPQHHQPNLSDLPASADRSSPVQQGSPHRHLHLFHHSSHPGHSTSPERTGHGGVDPHSSSQDCLSNRSGSPSSSAHGTPSVSPSSSGHHFHLFGKSPSSDGHHDVHSPFKRAGSPSGKTSPQLTGDNHENGSLPPRESSVQHLHLVDKVAHLWNHDNAHHHVV